MAHLFGMPMFGFVINPGLSQAGYKVNLIVFLLLVLTVEPAYMPTTSLQEKY